MKCEKCLKEYRNISVHILQHSKKLNNGCYSFYIKKYAAERLFPWKKDADKPWFLCECCGNYFHFLHTHILQHSDRCYTYYINKYIDEDSFPEGTLRRCYCLDCGKRIYMNHKYCAKCRQTKHNIMKISDVSKRNLQKRYDNYKLDPTAHDRFREKLRLSQIERFRLHPELAEKQRQYMLSGGAPLASSANRSTSRPQLQLFELVHKLYDETILNYTSNEFNYILDMAIPSLKIDIEYDGSYWHQDVKPYNIRDVVLSNLGWNIFRFRDRIPGESEIIKIVEDRKSSLNH